jgi:hypothetical protein
MNPENSNPEKSTFFNLMCKTINDWYYINHYLTPLCYDPFLSDERDFVELY